MTILRFLAGLLFSAMMSVHGYSQASRQIYAEAFGASSMFGVNYDVRFSNSSRWGWRVGVAYNSTYEPFYSDNAQETSAITIPVGVNMLLGGKRNMLELGVGVSTGVYNERKEIYTTSIMTTYTETDWAYFIFADIGYRHVSKSGIVLRAGINPSIYTGSRHNAKRESYVYPYVSVGLLF